MTCAHYMGPSCGLGCCLARAEQFALYEYNEPSFAEFCPLVQRYGEILNDVRAKKEKDQGVHWTTRRWQKNPRRSKIDFLGDRRSTS